MYSIEVANTERKKRPFSLLDDRNFQSFDQILWQIYQISLMCYKPYTYIQSKTLALIASNFCKVLYCTAREEEISLCTHFHKRKWPRFAHRKFHSDLFKTQLLTNFLTACFTSPLHHTPKSKCWELYCFRIFFTFFSLFSKPYAMVNK